MLILCILYTSRIWWWWDMRGQITCWLMFACYTASNVIHISTARVLVASILWNFLNESHVSIKFKLSCTVAGCFIMINAQGDIIVNVTIEMSKYITLKIKLWNYLFKEKFAKPWKFQPLKFFSCTVCGAFNGGKLMIVYHVFMWIKWILVMI